MSIRLAAPWGPSLTTAPLTEVRGNLILVWTERTPVGVSVQFALGQRSVILAWMFRKTHKWVGFGSYGWFTVRRVVRFDDRE